MEYVFLKNIFVYIFLQRYLDITHLDENWYAFFIDEYSQDQIKLVKLFISCN